MKLCAPIKHPSVVAIERANSLADLIEWRLDLFPQCHLESLRKKVKIPLILTLRSQKDFSTIEKLKPDYVDLPHDFPPDLIEKAKVQTRVILSFHEEQELVDWEEVYKKMEMLDPHHIKIAIQAKSIDRALDFLLYVKEKKFLGVAMGEKGKITRLLAPFYGAPWTYAPLTEDQRTANGQLLMDEYNKLYRIKEFEGVPQVYGLIGNPVDQSEGDRVHNFVYSMLEIPALYIKIPLEEEEVESFLNKAPHVGFKGLSVTMPHKRRVAHLIGLSHPVNTLHFKNGKWSGINTDISAALTLLGDLKGKKVAMIGAGATGEALCSAFIQHGADVSLYNRTPERAYEVGGRLGIVGKALDRLTPTFDILVNATSNLDPIAEEMIPIGRCVMDITARGELSPLLEKAKRKGCITISGDDFYYKQAAGQCAFWFL
jgi:3-dehydroquinate dehydratase / shikimate dehydrogenase